MGLSYRKQGNWFRALDESDVPSGASDELVALNGSGGLKAAQFYDIMPTSRVANVWRGGAGVNFGNQLLSAGVARASPFLVSSSTDFDLIAAIVATEGSADAIIRLGIYRFDDDGLGLSLIVDAGTVAADTTGVKSISIAETLKAGAYFLVGVSQGSPATHPTIRTSQTSFVEQYATVPSTPTNFVTGVRTLLISGLTGALPATSGYPGAAGASVNPYNITLRTA